MSNSKSKLKKKINTSSGPNRIEYFPSLYDIRITSISQFHIISSSEI